MEKDLSYLYERPVKSDTETPRECHILAMYHTFKGQEIPEDVYTVVLNSAERQRNLLKMTMDLVNESAGRGVNEEQVQRNMMAMAGAIIVSSGIDGPEAGERRLNHLGRYFQGYILVKEFGQT